MVILREKGRVQSSRSLLLKAAAYDIVSTHSDMPLQEIKTAEREIKRRSMVPLTNTPSDCDGCRKNPDSLTGIYITLVM